MNKGKKEAGAISRRKFIGNATTLSAFIILPRYVLGGKGFLAPSDRITLGFIGTGKQGTGLQRSFLDTGEVQITGASDVYAAKLDNFIKQVHGYYAARSNLSGYQTCQPHKDFRELLDRKDIDAVVVASPDFWHAAHVVRAAEAGKDVYGEKPLAHTIKEGRAMVTAIRKHNRVFQTGSMQRSWAEFRQAVELVRNGYIGAIKTIKVSVGGPPVPYNLPAQPLPEGLDWDNWLGPDFYHAYNRDIAPPLNADFWARWRSYKEFGGGGMCDWGAHMFDIAQWALDMDNSGPVEVIPPDGKEHPYLTYRYASGITMTHENFGKNNAVRFIGDKGQIDVERGKLETTPASLKSQVIGANEKHVYFSDNHYKDFLNAIRKRTPPVCDVEIGHRTATVCNIGNIAYELKRPLQWDPEEEKFRHDKEANELRGRKMRKEWAVKL